MKIFVDLVAKKSIFQLVKNIPAVRDSDARASGGHVLNVVCYQTKYVFGCRPRCIIRLMGNEVWNFLLMQLH